MTVRRPHFLLFSEARPAAQASRPGQWRFLLEDLRGDARLEVADEEPESSRDRLDLLAVVRGLEALDQPSRVTLVTNSRYIARGFRYGLGEWRENDWQWERFGQMTPIRNADLWRRVDRAMQFHDVQCRVWGGSWSHAAEGRTQLTATPRHGSASRSEVVGTARGRAAACDAAEPWYRRWRYPLRAMAQQFWNTTQRTAPSHAGC